LETLAPILKTLALIIDLIGVVILIYGFAKALLSFLRNEFILHPFRAPIGALQRIRCDIGVFILLALDFLIASDIIHTVMEITQEQLLELAAIVVIRTVIGYFLGKEVQELNE
jgi:uncharacterized membrane protein